MRRHVLVWNPDGVNPYGHELAHVLAMHGLVTHVVPVDAPETRCVLTTRRLLPANRAGSAKHRQAWRLLRALAVMARRHDVVVAAWTRSSLDEVVLWLLTLLGRRVVFVWHNPVHRVPLPRLREATMRLLARRAVVVTHHRLLAGMAAERHGVTARVARHPLYLVVLSENRVRREEPRGVVAFALNRADKGYDDAVRAVLAAKPPSLTLVGKGAPRLEDVAALKASGVEVTVVGGADFADERDVLGAVASAEVLLAPYREVTASGSVMLALSLGVPVVAYDAPTLRDLPVTLVPEGDVEALAGALHGGTSMDDRQRIEWQTAAIEEWASAVGP